MMVDDELLELIAHICTAFEVDGLRADIVIYKTASTLAAYDGRERVTAADVRRAAELALPHRRRRLPFDQPGLDRDRRSSRNSGSPPRRAGLQRQHQSAGASRARAASRA
jgi:Mg-chelatase subunit ChlI